MCSRPCLLIRVSDEAAAEADRTPMLHDMKLLTGSSRRLREGGPGIIDSYVGYGP